MGLEAGAQREEGCTEERSGRGARGGGGTPQRRARHPAHAAARLEAVAGPASAGPSCPRLLHHRPVGGGEATPLDRRRSGNGGHFGVSALAALERRRKKEEDGERERGSYSLFCYHYHTRVKGGSLSVGVSKGLWVCVCVVGRQFRSQIGPLAINSFVVVVSIEFKFRS